MKGADYGFEIKFCQLILLDEFDVTKTSLEEVIEFCMEEEKLGERILQKIFDGEMSAIMNTGRDLATSGEIWHHPSGSRIL